MIVWLPISMALAAFSQTEAPRLTLDEAVDLALKNAFSVRLGTSAVEKAKQQAKGAAGTLLPSFKIDGTYIRWDDNYPALSGSGGQFASIAATSMPSDSKSVVFTLTQIIDISGKIHKSVEAAKLSEKAQKLALDAELHNITNTVRGKFFGVLQAKAMVKVQADALKSAQERLDKANIRLKNGDVAKFDVLRLETDLKRSEQALLNAQSAYALAKQDLNNTLGREVDKAFDPEEVALKFATNERVAEDLVSLAYQNRSEVKAGVVAIQALTKVREMQERGNMPTMVLSAIHNRSIDAFPGQSQFYTYGIAAISWPVFDSGITRANVGAAKQDEEQGKIRLEQLKLGVSLEVQAAYTRLDTARKAYEVAKKGEELATEALRLAQLRFDEGAGILLDVITAQSDLTAAHGAVIATGYDYLTAYAAMQKAVGADDFETKTAIEEKTAK